MSDIILNLVIGQNSPDNNSRTNSEIQFNELVSKDPSSACYSLIQLSLDEQQFPVDIRQSCLLHLKRCIPKYWSMGFGSFVGPPVQQELKQHIRGSLLKLATSSPLSKIRNGSAYVIVQIAASDFPDEWPDLLQQLYALTLQVENQVAVIGGVTVLNDLFDDLITEEQFWEGNTGGELINHIMDLVKDDRLSEETKTHCLILYESVLNTLQLPEAFANDSRKRAVAEHISLATDIFLTKLDQSMSSATEQHLQLASFHFRGHVYKILNTFVSSFNKRVSPEQKTFMLELLMRDFVETSKKYNDVTIVSSPSANYNVVGTADLIDPKVTLPFTLIELSQCLCALQHDIPLTSSWLFEPFVAHLIICSQLSRDAIDDYEADFNTYVTVVSSLSTSLSVRDSIGELLSELNERDIIEITKRVFQEQQLAASKTWQFKECLLFLLENIFINDSELDIGVSLVELLKNLAAVSYEAKDLLTARAFLMLPKFFEKFESKLQIETFGREALANMIGFSMKNDISELIKVSILISITLYLQIMEVGKMDSSIQLSILELIHSIMEDSEEDTLAVLLEAMTVAITINEKNAAILTTLDQLFVIDLIFNISFKEPSDLQLTLDASECLKQLLEDISGDDYLINSGRSLPRIIKILESSQNADYSPEVSLSLDLLLIILESTPGGIIPDEIFQFTFPIIEKLLLASTDDQILQTGGQVFNNLLEKGYNSILSYKDKETGLSGLDILLQVTSKFLSPDLSDSAALNCGSIILTVIDKFLSVLGNDFLLQLLEATVKRLLISKEVITTENLITVFCNLVLSSPEDMINFLVNNINLAQAEPGKNGLELVLPIWFSTFEIIRGYEQIKKNTLAFGKLFTLGDERVELIIVNGDIIPYTGNAIRTRSMQREMPDQYTQISASLKILKLLVGELSFQNQQPDAQDYLPEENEVDNEDAEGGDDGWEDMDDIGVPNFEKLKSYVDSDGEDEHDGQNGNEDLKNILAQFFKECTTKNLGNFRKYYELLDDEEKRTISENVIFN